MDMDEEIIEPNEEIYLSKKAVLILMIGIYLFPDISEYNAFLTCKRKTEYLAFLLATKGYSKNKTEALREIKNIKSNEALTEYVNKIDQFISWENLLDILNNA